MALSLSGYSRFDVMKGRSLSRLLQIWGRSGQGPDFFSLVVGITSCKWEIYSKGNVSQKCAWTCCSHIKWFLCVIIMIARLCCHLNKFITLDKNGHLILQSTILMCSLLGAHNLYWKHWVYLYSSTTNGSTKSHGWTVQINSPQIHALLEISHPVIYISSHDPHPKHLAIVVLVD